MVSNISTNGVVWRGEGGGGLVQPDIAGSHLLRFRAMISPFHVYYICMHVSQNGLTTGTYNHVELRQIIPPRATPPPPSSLQARYACCNHHERTRYIKVYRINCQAAGCRPYENRYQRSRAESTIGSSLLKHSIAANQSTPVGGGYCIYVHMYILCIQVLYMYIQVERVALTIIEYENPPLMMSSDK